MTSVPFSKDAKELIRLLSVHEVRYILVGGMAVVYHGFPRFTADFDFFFERSRENASRLFKALKEFWGRKIPLVRGIEDLLKKGIIIQFGADPNRIDFINSLTGVSFHEAWNSRIQETISIEGRKFAFAVIGLDALIKNKKAVGRLKDLDDLGHLTAAAERQKAEKRPR